MARATAAMAVGVLLQTCGETTPTTGTKPPAKPSIGCISETWPLHSNKEGEQFELSALECPGKTFASVIVTGPDGKRRVVASEAVGKNSVNNYMTEYDTIGVRFASDGTARIIRNSIKEGPPNGKPAGNPAPRR